MLTELEQDLSLQHSLFEGFNDNGGILICGIEAGMSKNELELGRNRRSELLWLIIPLRQ
ncbi:MAG: hypothetical protein OXE78_03415 [Gammaproteobacteria bacterium]|nr:hypothetical protein [Gammaproteobacteria bacterium]